MNKKHTRSMNLSHYIKLIMLSAMTMLAVTTAQLSAQEEVIYEQAINNYFAAISKLSSPVTTESGNSIRFAGTNRLISGGEVELIVTTAESVTLTVSFWDANPCPSDPSSQTCGESAHRIATVPLPLTGIIPGLNTIVVINIDKPLDLSAYDDVTVTFKSTHPGQTQLLIDGAGPTIGTRLSAGISRCGDNSNNVCNGLIILDIPENHYQFSLKAVPPPCKDVTVNPGLFGQPGTISASDVYIGDANYVLTTNVSLSQTDFYCSNIGDNPVTVTLTYPNNQTSTCISTVTVTDPEPPLITPISDITVTAPVGDCEASVTLPPAVAVDNCGVAAQGYLTPLPAGNMYPMGTTFHTYYATDGGGNTVYDDFSVTVLSPTVDTDADGITDNCDLCPLSKNTCLDFDGIDDLITITHDARHDSPSFTITAQIKTIASNEQKMILKKGDEYEFYVSANNHPTNPNTLILEFPSMDETFIFFQPIANGTWRDVAAHYDAQENKVRFSIDGVQYNTALPVGNLANRTVSNADLTVPFNGQMDELTLWNKSLGFSEIKLLKWHNLNGTENGLVAYYDFNEGSPCGNNTGMTQLIDQVPNGINGTMQNFSLNGTSCHSNYITRFNSDSNNNGIGDDCDPLPPCDARFYTQIDTDGDGTFDCMDECPNDPYQIIATSCGCGNDRDVDGLCNGVDICPDNHDTALDFQDSGDGPGNTSDFIEIPHDPAFTLTDGDFAIEAWVYPTNGDHKTIITKGDGLYLSNYIFGIWADGTAPAPGKAGLWLADKNNATVGQWLFSNSSIVQNQWTHIAVSVDNSGLYPIASFYVNGIADGSTSYSIPSVNLFDTDTNPLFIGKQGYSLNSHFFDGKMDELAIWDKTVTAADMTASMQTPYVGVEQGLVAYYNFNEETACGSNTSFNTLKHINGSHDGTLIGFDKVAGSCYSNWVSGRNMGDCIPDICVEDLVLSGPWAQDEQYSAADHIESTHVISGSSDVAYDAGVCVDLLAGFEVDAGTTFHAYIDGCDFTSYAALINAGYSIQGLLAAGISIQDLLAGGVSIQELLDAGISIQDLLAGGVNSTFLIGLTAGGGIIFYVDASTAYTLVAAPMDQGGAAWGCDETEITGADGTIIGTGAQNTIDIVAGCTTGTTAADLCANLVLDGHSDWFLPSIDELEAMYDNIGPGAPAPNTNIGGFGDFSYYWSSSEIDEFVAWSTVFSDGYQLMDAKNFTNIVRAIRVLD